MSPGRVEQIFVFAESRADPTPLQEASVSVETGIEGDRRRAEHRSVTLLSLDQWKEVQAELAAEVGPELRRSNFMVRGIDLPSVLGKKLRLGEVEIESTVEIDPCGRMDEQHAGLREALQPQLRGGIGGRVCKGGTVRVGDPIVVIESSEVPS